MKHKQNLIVFIFLSLTLVVIFKDFIFGKRAFFGEDISAQNLVQREEAAKIIKQGYFPFWTDKIFAGFPLFAEGQTGVLYPFNILYLFLPGWLVFSYVTIFQFLFFGFSNFLLLSYFKVKRNIAVLSAFISMFFYLNNLSISNSLSGFIFFPLMLLFLLKIKNNFLYFIIFSLILGVQFLGIHLQTSYMMLFTLTLICLYQIILNLKSGLKITFLFTAGIIFGFLLSASQILTHWQSISLSTRSGKLPFDFVTIGSFIPARMLSNFLFFDTLEIGNALQAEPFYFFYIPLIFSIYCFFFVRKRFAYLFLFIFIYTLTISFGKYNPLYKLLYNFIPGFGSFRAPERFASVSLMFIPIFCSLGINNFLLKKRKPIFLLMGVFLFSTTLFGIYYYNHFPLSNQTLILFLLDKLNFFFIFNLVLGFVFYIYIRNYLSENIFLFLLFIFLNILLLINFKKAPAQFIPTNSVVSLNLFDFKNSLRKISRTFIVPKEIYKTEPKFIKFLKKDKSLFRVMNSPAGPIIPNFGMHYNLDAIDGYSPLSQKKHFYLSNFTRNESFLEMMNVKYLLEPTAYDFFEKWDVGEMVYEDYEVKIKKIENSFPRFRWFSSAVFLPTEEMIFKYFLNNKNFNPQDKIVILGNKKETIIFPSAEVKISKLKILPNKISFNIQTNNKGFLFISNTFYPDWKVNINGNPDKIYNANLLFQAIFLNKGKHKVELIFSPQLFYWGYFISITYIIVIILTLSNFKVEKKKYHT